MADDESSRLVQLNAWQRIRALFVRMESIAFSAVIIGVALSMATFFLSPKVEKSAVIPRDEFRQMIASINETQDIFGAIIPQLLVSDPKSAAAVELGLEKLAQVQDILKRQDPAATGAITLFQSAYAQSADDKQLEPKSEFNRPMILYGLLAVLVFLLVVFFAIYAFSKDAERVKFAQTNLQTLVSFVLGVVAGMLGTPTGA